MNDFDLAQVITTITVYAIPVLFAIALHEVAHGYTARFFGDSTAQREGRLSLNPAKHIDPIGTVLLPLVLYFFHLPPFGYAKPVPVDFSKLDKPKQQMVWVAAAGPAANFCMGLGWALFAVALGAGGNTEAYFYQMAQAGVNVNAAMMVFNLIPIPPLDGGRIVAGLLPERLSRLYEQIDRYGMLVFAGLVLLIQLHVIDGVLIGAMQGVITLFALIVSPLVDLLR